jgi:DNA polymerase-3 subunit epsilon
VLFGTAEVHTLDALCARLGVVLPEADRHTALGDARATAGALSAMLPMLQARGMATLDAVIAETRKHRRLLEDLN